MMCSDIRSWTAIFRSDPGPGLLQRPRYWNYTMLSFRPVLHPHRRIIIVGTGTTSVNIRGWMDFVRLSCVFTHTQPCQNYDTLVA